MMRKRSVGAMIAAVGASLAALGPAAAASAAPVQPGGRGGAPIYYLSVGDSLAYGYQAAIAAAQEASGHPDPSAFVGYGDVVDAALTLQAHQPVTQVDLGCPGETSTTFLQTSCASELAQSGFTTAVLHTPYSGTQMAAAEAFLEAHAGHVAAVTLSIGSNDLIGALTTCLARTGCDLRTQVGQSVQALVGNLGTIVGTIESADPGVPVAVANLYNPEIDNPSLSPAVRTETDALTTEVVNPAIAGVVDGLAKTYPVALADAYQAINHGVPWLSETTNVCVLTAMCTPAVDIHPNTLGYGSLGTAFVRALAGIKS